MTDSHIDQGFFFFRTTDGSPRRLFIPPEIWSSDEEFDLTYKGRYDTWLVHELTTNGEDLAEFDVRQLAFELIDALEAKRPEWREIQSLIGLKDMVGVGRPARLLRLDVDEDRDWLVPNLIARGGVTLIGGREKLSGKLLSLDTPIPTPTGWTTQGELHPGSIVFNEKGEQCRVVAETPVMLRQNCYRLTFSDGTSIVADANHKWKTRFLRIDGNKQERKKSWYQDREGTTKEIKDTLKRKSDGANRHSVKVTEALECPELDLLIPPYVLGVWLGDGTAASGQVTSADPQIIETVEENGYKVSKHKSKYHYGILKLQTHLRTFDLLKNKHIPAEYLRANVEQRLELLQGLMDTDGTCGKTGSCEFSTSIPALRDGMLELLRSLGIKPHVRSRQPAWPGSKLSYRIEFTSTQGEQIFRLDRKVERLKEPSEKRVWQSRYRHIVSVETVPSVPVKCVQVDTPSHLYLVGEGMIPTCNSTLLFYLLGALERTEPTVFGDAYKCPVKTLIVTEEPSYALRDKAERYDLNETWIVEDWVWPLDKFPGHSTQDKWILKLEQMETLARALKADHLVIDPFSRVAQIEDESGREMGIRAEAVSALAYRSGLAITLIHHNNKRADAEVEDRMRGSTSLTAAVEQIVQIDRHASKQKRTQFPRQRQMWSLGRVPEAEWERVIELSEDNSNYTEIDFEEKDEEKKAALDLAKEIGKQEERTEHSLILQTNGSMTLRDFIEDGLGVEYSASARTKARAILEGLVSAGLAETDKTGKERRWIALDKQDSV